MSALPQNVEAEMAVLGALMTGSPVVHEIADTLAGADFYQPANEEIFEACMAAHRAGMRLDPLVVGNQLGDRLGKVGGLPHLHTMTSSMPIASNAAYYAGIVAEASLGRRVVEAGTKIAQLGYDADDKSWAAEEARRIADEAATRASNEDTTIGAGDLLAETLDALQGDIDPGLATGWRDLDEIVNGMRPGQLVVVGARPSVGKSVIAANIAAAVCQQGAGVHFASLEMTRQEVMDRMLSAQATVALDRLMNHNLTEDDWDRIARKGDSVRTWPLRVDDTPAQSLLQLRARARNTSRRLDLGVVIVDYLQLMAPRDQRVPREQQVGELSSGLKALAKELGVPVIALAQLNRGSTDRQDKRPVMSDLRESGRIEADADHVWLLHREDLVDRNSASGELEVTVAKNRNGRAGPTVTLLFQGHYSRAVQSTWNPTKAIA